MSLPESLEQIENNHSTPVLPRNIEIERAVLGSFLLCGSAKQILEAREILPPDCFLADNRKIYAMLCEMAEQDDSINLVMLNHRLTEHGSKVNPASINAILDVGGLYSNSSLQSEFETLRQLAARREIMHLANYAFKEAQSRDCDVDALTQRIQSIASNLSLTDTGPKSKNNTHIREIPLTKIQVEKINWLWKRRIARGELTILEGIEGEGKSTVLCAIAGAVTCGQGLEDMIFDNGPENVLWLSAEDSLSHILKPRLLAAGADESRVFVVGEAFTFDEKGAALVRGMAERTKPALIVIDPIFAYTKGDPNKGADARVVTNLLKQIAEDFKCAIVLVRHVGKSKGLGDPRAAGLYSIEWRAAARSVLLCGSDPDNSQIKALTQHKNNISPLAESIGYKLVESSPGSEVSRAEWTGKSQLTAKQILAQVTDEDEKAARVSAEDFLKDLFSKGEEKPATDVFEDAKKNRISDRSLIRMKAKLGIQSRSEGFGKDKKWYWYLPAEDEKPPAGEAQNDPPLDYDTPQNSDQ